MQTQNWLVLSSIIPIFGGFGEHLQNLGEKAEVFSKNVNLFPFPLIGIFFLKKPTNFRYARMLHQFVKCLSWAW